MGRPGRALGLERIKPMALPWAESSLSLRDVKTPAFFKRWYDDNRIPARSAKTVCAGNLVFWEDGPDGFLGCTIRINHRPAP